MHTGSRTLFEGLISVDGPTGSTTFQTSPEHFAWLGAANRLVVQGHYQVVHADHPHRFKLDLETSGDGVRWKTKHTFWDQVGTLPFTGDAWGAEPETTNPSMIHARCAITMEVLDAIINQNVYLVQIVASSRSRTKRIGRPALGRVGTSRPRTPFTEPTMQEIYRHLLASTHLHAGQRAQHVLSHLSTNARREVEAFTRNLVGMHPTVKGTIASFAGALLHLMQAPEYGPGGPAQDAVVSAFDAAATEPRRATNGRGR